MAGQDAVGLRQGVPPMTADSAAVLVGALLLIGLALTAGALWPADPTTLL